MANLPGSSTGYGKEDLHKFESGAAGNAASTHTASDTSIDLESGQGSQFPADNFAVYVPDTDEWLWVSDRSGDTLTVERDLNGNAGGGKEIPNDAEVRLVMFENHTDTVAEEVKYLTEAVLGENQLDVTIQATTADGSTSPLTLQDSAGTQVFDVASDAVVTVRDTAGGANRTLWSPSNNHIPQGRLENDSITISTGDGITSDGDGTLALGDTETYSIVAGDISGSGLTMEGTPADLAVGSGTGITVNANDVAVDQSFAPTWTGAHTFNSGLTMGSTLTMNDAENIAVGSTTGTQIATAATQLLGFFGTTPVAQQTAPASLTDNSGGTTDDTVEAVSGSGADAAINNNFAELAEEVNAIRTVLVNLGLAA